MLTLRRLPLLSTTPVKQAQWSRVARARRVVLSFLASVVAVNVVLSIGMDTAFPWVRDAEYTSRRQCIEARVEAHPGRPLVVSLGSSRTDHGIRPLTLPEEGPLLVNSSQVGAGPLLQLLTLKRLLHEGIEPKMVLVEYWPPFLHGRGAFNEFVHIDPHRYYPSDEGFIRDYHPDPTEMLRLMREIRRTPVWNHRQRLLSQTLPSWLPYTQRLDGGFSRLDAAGWTPALDNVSPSQRTTSVEQAARYYRPLLTELDIDPKAERALREILAMCRQRGIRVKLLWMPESSEFRSWYPPSALTASEALFVKLQSEFNVPVIRSRDWIADEYFVDGYHLTPTGAAAFTAKLRPFLNPD